MKVDRVTRFRSFCSHIRSKSGHFVLGQNQVNKKRFSNEKPSNYLRRQVSQSKQLQPVAPQQSRRYEIKVCVTRFLASNTKSKFGISSFKDDEEEDSDDHLVPVTHFGRNMEVVGEFEKVRDS